MKPSVKKEREPSYERLYAQTEKTLRRLLDRANKAFNAKDKRNGDRLTASMVGVLYRIACEHPETGLARACLRKACFALKLAPELLRPDSGLSKCADTLAKLKPDERAQIDPVERAKISDALSKRADAIAKLKPNDIALIADYAVQSLPDAPKKQPGRPRTTVSAEELAVIESHIRYERRRFFFLDESTGRLGVIVRKDRLDMSIRHCEYKAALIERGFEPTTAHRVASRLRERTK
jgi:hypothetical protein